MSAYFLIYAIKTGLERTKTAANTPTANIGTNNTPHLSIKYQTVPNNDNDINFLLFRPNRFLKPVRSYLYWLM